MRTTFSVLSICLCLTACTNQVQTTSGASYLERHKSTASSNLQKSDGSSLEDHIRKVAAVEPTLKFPARIGIARVEHGQLVTVPSEEMLAWEKTQQQVGSGIGEFVAVNPMVAKLASQTVPDDVRGGRDAVINEIRLGAARQHLDAVLIYEVFSKTETESNLLSLIDLSIIGAFILPSKAITADAFANAMLIDVVQGYPYGTADVVVDKQVDYSTSIALGTNSDELSKSIQTKAAIKLCNEVESMLTSLKKELKHKTSKK